MAQNYPEKFHLHYTVDIKPDENENWKYDSGFMTKEMVEKHMPAPGPDTMILYCGPPIFEDIIKKFCTELGYSADMLFKF